MAEPRPSNVLPFEPHGASLGQPLSAEATHLLGVCRDRLVHGVATAFAGNLGKANDDLLGMADRATSLEQQQLYFAAMELLANRGQALLEAFRSAYVARFDADLAGLRRGRGPERAFQLGELSLIDNDDFERDLAIDKLSARAACNCSNQLTALERRLAALLRLPRIGQDENPLYPRALFNAVLGGLATLGVSDQLALTLLQEFERQTSVELPGIYNGLNQALVDAGVLPKIPSGPVWPAPRSEVEGLTPERAQEAWPEPGRPGELAEARVDWSAAQRAAGHGDPGSEPELGNAGDQLAPSGGQDVFLQLARALQASLGAGVGVGVPSPVPPTPLLPGGAVAPGQAGGGGPAIGAGQLIAALSSLQRGRADIRDLPGLGAVAIDLKAADVLRQLRSTPLVSWSHPLDAMTVDIVALLFEAIFKDPDLSAALRAEIAKLQIPVLKVALMDKTFFSNARDPARRLLDGIANAGIGRDAAEEGRLTEQVRACVDAVVEGFDTDVSVFERQVQALEAFLKQEEQSAGARAGEVVQALEAEERRAQAQARVDAEIASRTRGRPVPLLVAEFLDRHWRIVLAEAYRRGGEQGEPWRQAVATLEDLVWSVGPKRRAGDRERLLTTLPGLLKRLRAGLEGLGIGDTWDPFFAQLIRLHVAALRNEIPPPPAPNPAPNPPPGAAPQGQAQRPPERSGAAPAYNLASFRTLAQVDAGTGIPFQSRERPSVEPTSAPAAPPAEGDRHLELARSLKVGAWVELESDRGTRKTLRLSWVSELRGVYLFTNRQGENALTLAATSLAEHLRKGTARILSQDRITERAVAQLLGSAEPAK